MGVGSGGKHWENVGRYDDCEECMEVYSSEEVVPA